ncbi:uncharacterized protein LOC110697964 [Chenopodium quinoa]|uniref:uncharacterized protein LOC110697964 n=1 Tax=Chenopodium quinoa TaxID=63459 RepID=UPI000B76FD3A|nr:uncharacterized protein LOC110697964 [Chenopodium quinoa]
MLRVHGLRRSINEKTKEVKAANACSASSHDKAMFQIDQNEILMTEILYSQATANLQVKADLDAAKKQVFELEQQVKDLKAKLQALQEAEKEADDLRTRVDKLKQRLANQETQLAKKYASRANEEKRALVNDMMDDCNIIMEMTWAALFPDASYEGWKSKFATCTQEYIEKIMNAGEEEEGKSSDSASRGSDQEE